MLECWNAGRMGFGIIGKICVDDKIKSGEYPFKINFPAFHYSIIPCLRQALKPQKIFYIFIKL
jgi:hypothetical protein